MIWLAAALIISLFFTAGFCYVAYVAVKKNLELSDQREVLVDTIEESLDVLDECFTSIARASEIPVLSDEPIVRDLLSDIKRAKNAVLTIASKVVIYGQDKNAERDERDEA